MTDFSLNQLDLKSQFKLLNYNLIAPFIKGLGFKKKGDNYYRSLNDITQYISLQKSRWNSNERIEFTFNIGFYNSAIYNLTHESQILPTTIKEYDCLVNFRLGHFIHETDHWYTLSVSNGFNNLKEEITNDFINYLQVIFATYQDLISLEPLMKHYNEHRPVLTIEYYFHILEPDKATSLLRSTYHEAVVPKSSTQTINFPDGSQDIQVSEPSVNLNFIKTLQKLASRYNVELF